MCVPEQKTGTEELMNPPDVLTVFDSLEAETMHTVG